MDSFSGYLEHIIFRNEDNGYTVFLLNCDDGEELTCVGSVSSLDEGEYLTVNGELTDHPTYGPQLKISSVESALPQDVFAIERYLGSGSIRGVGQKLAHSITKKFGEDTFRIIEEEPERLAEIKGISIKKAFDISLQLDEKRDMRQAMLFLQQYGISPNLAAKIYDFYEEEIYRIIRENPYQMADDIEGVGFRIADEIAEKSGILVDSDFRIRSGLLYVLSQAQGEGHLYLPQEILLSRAEELLSVPVELMEKFLLDLAIERKIIRKDMDGVQAVYTPRLYQMEYHTAVLLSERSFRFDISKSHVQKRIQSIEETSGISLDEMQKKAVITAIECGLMIITGGPGTGKTTTIHTLLRYFEEEGLEIALAAPTGRAARRMTEATGREAQTIHRLLEVKAGPSEGSGPGMFERNADNPLEYDVIIIDEMSMVDIYLMHALLSALPDRARLLLVGDTDQLPSVGPGSVLKDIIASHAFNVVMLTRIFRQAAQSDIIVNAHRVRNGDALKLDNQSRDFFFLKRDDPNRIIRNMIELVQEKLPPYVDAKPEEIQILTPMRKGNLGVERLNHLLQEYLNPPSSGKAERTFGDTVFRTGDKIMQIRNNYQLEWKVRGRSNVVVEEGVGVFNGDIGTIQRIDTMAEEMLLLFDDGREVQYPFACLEELELAYAITIHKAQGSEYPAVVLPLLSGSPMLMNRNLLYTAVTRAKKCVTILGSSETIAQMVQNTSEVRRYTGLAKWIREMDRIGVREQS